MNVRLYLILCLIFLAGCHPPVHTLVKPPLQEEGEVYLYTRPFPAEADRLTFSLESVAAVREDGREVFLAVPPTEMGIKTRDRQRFLGSAALPAGNYRGLSFRVARPRLLREEGTASLLAPEGAVIRDFPFTVTPQRALFISLGFDYSAAVSGGFSFTPAFILRTPPKPLTALVGYVTNSGANTITVIDKKAKEVVGVIATGRGPRGVVFDQQRKRGYVALSGEDAVSVYDIATGEELRRIRLSSGDATQELALNPDGTLLLTVNPGSNTVSFIDPLGYFELTRVAVPDGPSSLFIDPAGLRAYVFSSLAASLSVIDIGRRQIVATVTTEAGTTRGALNRGGTRLYEIHDFSAYITVLNAATLAQLQRYYVGMGGIALKVDTLTDLVYLGKLHDAQLGVYEPYSFNTIATVRTGSPVRYMTIDNDDNRLFALVPGEKKVAVINLATNGVEAEMDVDADADQVALIGER